MASKAWAVDIAGRGSTSEFFGRHDLRQSPTPKIPSLRVNTACRWKMCATSSAPAAQSCVLPAGPDPLYSLTQHVEDVRERITPELLDEMMYDSVTEIIKNMDKAPFLMKVFLGGGGPAEEKWRLCPSSPRLLLEKGAVTSESWPLIKKRWEQDNCVPDGVIIVEELEEEEEKEGSAAPRRKIDDEDSRRWGMVIEGRGMECCACYILDTCRVISPFFSCTHFSLVKANCNGDPVGVQVMNAWLQRRGNSLF